MTTNPKGKFYDATRFASKQRMGYNQNPIEGGFTLPSSPMFK